MSGQKEKEPKIELFRVSLVDDGTHKLLWDRRFTRTQVLVWGVSVLVVAIAVIYSIIAFTPVRTFIPGYPNSATRRAAIQNAITIDSLERVVNRWEFYTDNLRRVMAGEDPVRLDSLAKRFPLENAAVDKAALEHSDSVLRGIVADAEQFALTGAVERELPVEGQHFFTPLKGTVSKGFDLVAHPYIDVTAPSGSVVMSVLDGTVVFSGWNDETGYIIVIQHANDLLSIYEHNQKLLKNTGDKVFAGTPVALVGNTGSLTQGDHLHFELWYKGESIDPAQYINF